MTDDLKQYLSEEQRNWDDLCEQGKVRGLTVLTFPISLLQAHLTELAESKKKLAEREQAVTTSSRAARIATSIG